MLSALIALGGAFVFGAADFLGGLAAKRLRSIVVTATAAASGLIVLLAMYPLVGGGAWLPADIGWGALSGLFGAIAIALLYACLAIGPMSILSPLTAVVSAILPMAWGLVVKGESLSPIGWAGLGLALVAVVVVGFIPGEKVARPTVAGLVMAVGAGLSIGAFLIVIDQTSSDSGLVPIIVNRATNFAITGLIVGMIVLRGIRRSQSVRAIVDAQGPTIGATPSGHADLEHATARSTSPRTMTLAHGWWLAASCGALDALANAAQLAALRLGDLSIVAALTAMYPAGTILLAALVLRERIAPIQWVGLVLALAAGALLALA